WRLRRWLIVHEHENSDGNQDTYCDHAEPYSQDQLGGAAAAFAALALVFIVVAAAAARTGFPLDRCSFSIGRALAVPLAIVPALLFRRLGLLLVFGSVGLFHHETVLALGAIDLPSDQIGISDRNPGLAAWALLFKARGSCHVSLLRRSANAG